MSGRYDYSKGSSRSARDDSRHEKRRERDRSRSPRSRSPRRQRSPEVSRNRYSKERSRDPDTNRDRNTATKLDKIPKHTEWDESSDDEVPAPPPPPRISKISMGFAKPAAPIKMNIGAKPSVQATKPTIASVFNADDDDDEPEEMPAEARMRMRNIGRETPTSAGPNSFGKTKQGFCDAKKLFEKNLKQQLDETNERPVLPKFPQTIYKIKPT
ncbi:PEST proteolytic signal-containing nuclear protein-like [Leguminivora glycinivorella]|uniref:PEST proteolytic signal-containing nuclear protein-like n=1 Tax=Leguminivora glycinivorella TaxID=1035111 RepID=UPI0020100B70|nr:PEST proteolytic signal-containing nuclear protein-like [Leguminivora glycinivorella]